MKNKIIENIKNTANEIARKKVEEELKNSQSKIEREEKTILEICEKIQTGFWVKRVETSYFVVATLEEFEKDYFNKSKYGFEQGLRDVTETSFKINGNSYFHICDLWKNYNKKINDFNYRINELRDRLTEIEQDKEEFLKKFYNFKKCLIDYQKLQDKESGKLEEYLS